MPFATIASIHTRAEGDDIGWDRSRAGAVCQGNPMIHTQALVKEAFFTATDGTTVSPILHHKRMVSFRKRKRDVVTPTHASMIPRPHLVGVGGAPGILRLFTAVFARLMMSHARLSGDAKSVQRFLDTTVSTYPGRFQPLRGAGFGMGKTLLACGDGVARLTRLLASMVGVAVFGKVVERFVDATARTEKRCGKARLVTRFTERTIARVVTAIRMKSVNGFVSMADDADHMWPLTQAVKSNQALRMV
jgi:hypothetical protein